MKLSVNPDKLAFQANVSKDTGTKLTLMNAAHDGNPYQIFTTIKQIENMKSDDEISFARKSAKNWYDPDTFTITNKTSGKQVEIFYEDGEYYYENAIRPFKTKLSDAIHDAFSKNLDSLFEDTSVKDPQKNSFRYLFEQWKKALGETLNETEKRSKAIEYVRTLVR